MLGVKFTLAMANDEVLDAYGPIRSIPTTFFINRKGEVVRLQSQVDRVENPFAGERGTALRLEDAAIPPQQAGESPPLPVLLQGLDAQIDGALLQRDIGVAEQDFATVQPSVHHSAIVSEGFRTLAEGATVTYEVESSDKGPRAVNVQTTS